MVIVDANGLTTEIALESSKFLPHAFSDFTAPLISAMLHLTNELTKAIYKYSRALKFSISLIDVHDYLIFCRSALPMSLSQPPPLILFRVKREFWLTSSNPVIPSAGSMLEFGLAQLDITINSASNLLNSLRHNLAPRALRKLHGAGSKVLWLLDLSAVWSWLCRALSHPNCRLGQFRSFTTQRPT